MAEVCALPSGVWFLLQRPTAWIRCMLHSSLWFSIMPGYICNFPWLHPHISNNVSLYRDVTRLARRAVSAARPSMRPTRPPAAFPCCVPTLPAAGPRAALQTTRYNDDSQQNNNGPLGGPVTIYHYLLSTMTQQCTHKNWTLNLTSQCRRRCLCRHHYLNQGVTLISDLQNLIKSSAEANEYSPPLLSKLFKLFMRYCGNNIWPANRQANEWTNRRMGQPKNIRPSSPTLSSNENKNTIHKKCNCASTETATNHASVVKWSHTCEHFKKLTKERQWWFSSTELPYTYTAHLQ